MGATLAALALAIALSVVGGCDDVRPPKPKTDAGAPSVSRILPKQDAAAVLEHEPVEVRQPRASVSPVLLPLTEAERQERNARVFALLLYVLPALHSDASQLGRGRR